MALRFDKDRKPVGLDWSVCTDGTDHPEVWKQAGLKRNEPSVSAELKAAGSVSDRPAPKRLERAVEMHVIRMYRDEKLSALEIGRAVGIQPATVFKVLRRNGVPTRSRSEGMRISRAKRHVAA